MSLRQAVIAVWRKLVEGRAPDLPRYDDGFHPSLEAQARTALQTQAEALMQGMLPRVPVDLRSALEHVVVRSPVPPTDALSLMNEVSAQRTGLGIAIGRGGVPSQDDALRYRQLGELERWMDQDLGHPEGTHHAVLRRAVERLEGRAAHGDRAPRPPGETED